MRAFIRNCLRIAGIFILLGLFLMAAGYSMDDTIFNDWNDFSFSVFDENDFDGFDFWDSNRETKENKISGVFDGDVTEEAKHDEVKVKNEYVSSENSSPTKLNNSENDKYEDVEALSLDIAYGTVKIKSGDHFDIEIKNVDSSEIENKIEDGVWIIKDYKGDNSSDISLFGVKINVDKNAASVSLNKAANVEITIPEGYEFNNFELKLDAGSLKVDKVDSENAYIDVGAGNCNINHLEVAEDSYYSVGTGELVIDDIKVNNATFECGVGNLSAEGIITGDNTVTCGIGNVNLDVDGDFKDYNYNVNCGLGSVTINKSTYSGVNSKRNQNNDADNNFLLECGIGKISLNIN
jgi:hypothetical protein